MPEIVFHGNLQEILPVKKTVLGRRSFPRAAKDLVETLGIPHTEIGRIEINGKECGILEAVSFEDRIEIFPYSPPRPSPWNVENGASQSLIAFLADVNVAGAGKLLRLMGFDTLIDPALDDRSIATLSWEQKRVVLTRDRNLLKRRIIAFGYLVRNEKPWEQLAEIFSEYGLKDFSRPFSRCARCNTPLAPVEKEEVMDRLQPMTKRFYNTFQICPSCKRIFWKGSHIDHIAEKMARM